MRKDRIPMKGYSSSPTTEDVNNKTWTLKLYNSKDNLLQSINSTSYNELKSLGLKHNGLSELNWHSIL